MTGGKSPCDEVEQHLGAVLSRRGFTLVATEPDIVYGERPAWAVYYRGADCKLQICWSAREGGVEFLLAPLDAPNEFGLVNESKKWQFLLSLSESDDGLVTPSLDAGGDTWWDWRKALLEAHIDDARDSLLSGS